MGIDRKVIREIFQLDDIKKYGIKKKQSHVP